MNAEQAWQSALSQLQTEMPKASFDNWVRDARLLSYEDGVFTIGTASSVVCDWLESRLTSTVIRLLMGMMNREVEVRFVVVDGSKEQAEDKSDELGDDEQNSAALDKIRVTAEYSTDYERTVKPNAVIVLPGYILRLVPERGAAAILAYIGFYEASWLAEKGKTDGKKALEHELVISTVARFAGVSRRTFFSWMSRESFWHNLRHLVERTDGLGVEKGSEERGRGKHPNPFRVYLTPPLTRADALYLQKWIAQRMSNGRSVMDAVAEALAIPSGSLSKQILAPLGYDHSTVPDDIPVNVNLLLRRLKGADLLEDEALAAEALHVRITRSAFSNFTIPHYYVLEVIPKTKLTPEQALAIAIARYRCYRDPETTEVSNTVNLPNGETTIAQWIGLERNKTVWEWMNGYAKKSVGQGKKQKKNEVKKQHIVRTGTVPAFLRDVTKWWNNQPDKTAVKPPTKVIAVRLLEPIFDGTDSWQEWDPQSDLQIYTIVANHVRSGSTIKNQKDAPGKPARDIWSLGDLFANNNVFPNIRVTLRESGVDVTHYIAWLLYCFAQANLDNHFDSRKYPVTQLMRDPRSSPGPEFLRLASMPPSMIRTLVESTDAVVDNGTDFPDWDNLIGRRNPKIGELKRALFGD